jgi:arginyl-tRNA synthetase
VITFDMQEALAFTGETGPYVQNSVVRARNILAKLTAEGHDTPALLQQADGLELSAYLDGEDGDEAWSLLMLMARTDDVVEQAIRGLEATLLAKHAFGVAQTFHAWYQRPENTVLRAATPELRAFRAAVVDAFVRQLETLTRLLGIPTPDRM